MESAVEVEMVTCVDAIGAPVIDSWNALVRVVAVVDAYFVALLRTVSRVVVEIAILNVYGAISNARKS